MEHWEENPAWFIHDEYDRFELWTYMYFVG